MHFFLDAELMTWKRPLQLVADRLIKQWSIHLRLKVKVQSNWSDMAVQRKPYSTSQYQLNINVWNSECYLTVLPVMKPKTLVVNVSHMKRDTTVHMQNNLERLKTLNGINLSVESTRQLGQRNAIATLNELTTFSKSIVNVVVHHITCNQAVLIIHTDCTSHGTRLKLSVISFKVVSFKSSE